jgi:hypothetical protein
MLAMSSSPINDRRRLGAAFLVELMRRGRRNGKQKFYDAVQSRSTFERLAPTARLWYSAGHEQGSFRVSN